MDALRKTIAQHFSKADDKRPQPTTRTKEIAAGVNRVAEKDVEIIAAYDQLVPKRAIEQVSIHGSRGGFEAVQHVESRLASGEFPSIDLRIKGLDGQNVRVDDCWVEDIGRHDGKDTVTIGRASAPDHDRLEAFRVESPAGMVQYRFGLAEFRLSGPPLRLQE